MNPYPNPYPGAYLFSQPEMDAVAMGSLPFAATQAFIRRGIGAGAVDRCISLDTPMRFLYTNQLAGSRPPLPFTGIGPIVPDTIPPGLDTMLMCTTCLDGRPGVGVGGGVPVGEFGTGLPYTTSLNPLSLYQYLQGAGAAAGAPLPYYLAP